MSIEWQEPGVVLSSRPHGEGGAVVTLLTEGHGRHAGLVRGGSSRAQASLWLPGNLVAARWVARLPEQLGTLSGELAHAGAALAMDHPLQLAVLSAACALADAALPEREAFPRCFRGLVELLAELSGEPEPGVVARYVRWEAELLAELGYGLDLSRCAATGSAENLVWVSPRSGRAVSAAAGAPYRDRLFPLPPFLLGQGPSGPEEWAAGLRITGHFLQRDAFGEQHRPLPAARGMLLDRLLSKLDFPTERSGV